MMSAPIRYQKIKIEDPLFKSVFELRHHVLRAPIGLSLYEEDTSKDWDDQIFVAVQPNQQIVACLMAKPIAPGLFKFRQMAVLPEFQGQGVGKALMLFAEQELMQQHCQKIELHARATAETFYQKLGYTTYGPTFIEVGIPHLLMEKFF